MTEIKHIFFDIGGVLGSNGWDREQRNAAVQHFGLPAEDFQWRHEEVAGEWEEGRITLDEYLDIAVFYTERKFSRQEFREFMCAQSIPHEETISIARALSKDPRYTLMTLNNESEELNRHRIDTFGLNDLFTAFLSSCWLGVRKPSRAMFERALGIAEARPERVLFIDDREQNLAPARAMGFQTLHYTGAAELEKSLGDLGLI